MAKEQGRTPPRTVISAALATSRTCKSRYRTGRRFRQRADAWEQDSTRASRLFFPFLNGGKFRNFPLCFSCFTSDHVAFFDAVCRGGQLALVREIIAMRIIERQRRASLIQFAS
jgi:hypothetical protein